MWSDTHFHIEEEDTATDVIAAGRQAGVELFIVQGTSYDDIDRTAAVANPASGVYATVGLHPHVASTYHGMEPFRRLLAEPGVVAVGEIGLDYHYDISPRESQRNVFALFLQLARELAMPAVIHCREAFDDCYAIVKNAALDPNVGFVIHSFTGTVPEARAWLDLGAMISVNGMVTFNKADNIREALAVVPLDRLLLETDSPYLAPKPFRGQRNNPSYIPLIGQRVADEKGRTPEEIAAITLANAKRLFRLQGPDSVQGNPPCLQR